MAQATFAEFKPGDYITVLQTEFYQGTVGTWKRNGQVIENNIDHLVVRYYDHPVTTYKVSDPMKVGRPQYRKGRTNFD